MTLQKNFPPIFTKFWQTKKKRAPPDQNWASLNKFIDKIRECWYENYLFYYLEGFLYYEPGNL